MKYVMEMHQKKNAIKNVIMSRVEAESPFPLYPPGTHFEIHGTDFVVVETVVCYHIDSATEENRKEFIHKVLLIHA